ncbi:hypothetical protein PHMEG_00020886, partial [Phytophthora megakarya]
MNAVIKGHQGMYDHLENRLQLAHRSNEIMTKEVNHARSEYLVGVQAFKKSHDNLHKLLSLTDPTNSALGSRLRHEDMDAEALVLMVEDKDSLADDIARAKIPFPDLRVEKQRKAEEAAATAGRPSPPPLTFSVRKPSAPPVAQVVVTGVEPSSSSASFTSKPSEEAKLSAVSPHHSPPVSKTPAPPVSVVKTGKGKAKRQRNASDDGDVDFGGGDSGEDVLERTHPELVKLAQRASDLLTPYVAPDFTTASAQKYLVKLKQSLLLATVPSDAEVKCTTIGIQKFSVFMADDHPESTTQSGIVESGADFAIYERKHWVELEAIKRFFSPMTARLGEIKNTKERLRFELGLEHLKKVWYKYNKNRVDRADNLHVALVCWSNSPLPIVTLLDPTSPLYTMDNLMWLPGSAYWCAEAALVDKSEPWRADWLTYPEQHVEVLGPDSSLTPEDIDSSWDRAFRGADEDEEMEAGKAGEGDLSPPAPPGSPISSDADSVTTMNLDQDSADDA